MKILEWGVYLIVFCLPLYLVRFTIFDVPTTALELMIYALFIVWLVKEFKLKDLKNLLNTHYLLFIAISLILIGLSVATFYSWDQRTSLGILKAWLVDPLLFFVVFINVIKKEQLRKVFYGLILSGFVVSVISLICLSKGNLDIRGRLQGPYDSPNYLAMYLAPILIIGLGLVIWKKDYSLKRPLLACLWANNFFLIIVLIFSKSFGAWLGIIGAICFGLVLYFYKKNRKIVLGIICLGIILVFMLGYWKFVPREGKLSLDSRLMIWQKAWQVFKWYPIIGIGPGTFDDYFPAYPRWGVPQPHSIYLAFLLQTGIIGFIGFIWLLFYFFRRGFKLLNTYYSSLIIVSTSVMVYILIHGLIDTTYWKNDLAVVFWLIIGTAAILKEPD